MADFSGVADAQLFDETFTITALNDKKYDRVARVAGTSAAAGHDTALTLDVNTELYPVAVGETIQLVLASTLSLDGTKEARGWRDLQRSHERTLADDFDYVCRGKIYRFEEGGGENLKVYISFGGLLLFLEGPFKKLTSLRIDYVYMLIKK